MGNDFLCCRVAEQAFVFSRSSMNWPQLKTPIGTWGHNTYGQSVVVDIKNASSKWQMSYFTQGEDLKIQTSVYNISQWGLTNNDRPCMFLSGKTIDETYTPLSEGTNCTYDISNDGNALAITDDALPTLVYRLTTMPSGEEQIEGYWLGGSSAYGWAGVNVSNGRFLFYASDHRFEATLNAYQGGHASITINRYIEVTTDGHGHTQETEIEFQDLDAHKWPGLRGTVDVPIYRMGKLPGSSDEWTYLMYPSGDGSNELIRLVRQ